MGREPSRQADPAVEKVAAGHIRDRNDRRWTAVERHKLRGLIGRGLPVDKIARTLRRPLASIELMATTLGLLLNGDPTDHKRTEEAEKLLP